MGKSDRLDRSRYIAVVYAYARILKPQELWRMLSAQANSLYGIWGALRMGIYQSYASEDLPFVIYRVSNRHLGKLLMVLASCREYGGQGFAFLTLRTSGTIASIKELETNEGTRSFFAESVKSGSLIRGKSKKLS